MIFRKPLIQDQFQCRTIGQRCFNIVKSMFQQRRIGMLFRPPAHQQESRWASQKQEKAGHGNSIHLLAQSRAELHGQGSKTDEKRDAGLHAKQGRGNNLQGVVFAWSGSLCRHVVHPLRQVCGGAACRR